MNKTQRQIVLLMGFMTLLTIAFLYFFVYAEPPLELPGLGLFLPEPVESIVDIVFEGWAELIEDMTFSNSTSTGPRGR